VLTPGDNSVTAVCGAEAAAFPSYVATTRRRSSADLYCEARTEEVVVTFLEERVIARTLVVGTIIKLAGFFNVAAQRKGTQNVSYRHSATSAVQNAHVP
jgi:hypothetical protein